jgi:hypothetical protein
MLAAMYRAAVLHDDSKLFVVSYVGLSIVLAFWLGLFWLAVVVLAHLLLEIIKQHDQDARPLPVLSRSLWELKLDVGLVLFGLVIALYMGVILGAAGLGAAARVGVRAATRVGIWQRGLRGLLMSVDDVANIASRAGSRRGKKAVPASEILAAGVSAVTVVSNDGVALASRPDYQSTGGRQAAPSGAAEPEHRPDVGAPGVQAAEPMTGAELWGGWLLPRWPRGDRFSLGFTFVCLLLILGTPLLIGQGLGETWAIIVHEMRP